MKCSSDMKPKLNLVIQQVLTIQPTYFYEHKITIYISLRYKKRSEPLLNWKSLVCISLISHIFPAITCSYAKFLLFYYGIPFQVMVFFACRQLLFLFSIFISVKSLFPALETCLSIFWATCAFSVNPHLSFYRWRDS